MVQASQPARGASSGDAGAQRLCYTAAMQPADMPEERAAAAPQPWYLGSPVRRLRLASGLVLFAYVTTHLLNHALCNASYQAADQVLLVQKWIWQGIAGTLLLYGALFAHMALGLGALYARRYFRWTRTEITQLVMGLAFPALLANHLSVTRTALTLYGLDKGYIAELASLWVTAPRTGWLQMAVLLAAWTHGCIGLFLLLRLRRGFPAFQPVLLAAAVLIPVLAMLGFVQGGREIARALAVAGFHALHLGPSVTGTPAQVAHLAWLRNHFIAGYLAAIGLVLIARLARRLLELRRGLVVISYPGDRRVRVPRGLSVLDASTLGRIPHASVCGGRGRCSTCRVRVILSEAPLPPASPYELQVLAGIGADPSEVRLACQLRPTAHLLVAPLIPPSIAMDYIAGRTARTPGEERFVAAMFIDLRGSTGLAERRTPFDSVFLLGRFIEAVSRTVVNAGGRPVQFVGDGVLALFGLETEPRIACRQALAALGALAGQLQDVAALFRQEAQQELRYGVGLHCGRTIVGEIGFASHLAFTALGEAVNVAHRLQEMARDEGAMAVVSDAVLAMAGETALAWQASEVAVRGREARLAVRIVREPMPSLVVISTRSRSGTQ